MNPTVLLGSFFLYVAGFLSLAVLYSEGYVSNLPATAWSALFTCWFLYLAISER